MSFIESLRAQDDSETDREAVSNAAILQKSCHPEPLLHCEIYFVTEVPITEWLSMARAGSP